jgi:hypothetical protein
MIKKISVNFFQIFYELCLFIYTAVTQKLFFIRYILLVERLCCDLPNGVVFICNSADTDTQ